MGKGQTWVMALAPEGKEMTVSKKIYFAMTTHPNMNYDRSLRSVIWEQFPKLYRLYQKYLRDNPPLKSHMQLPPQTLLSLKQCAPDVREDL